MAKIISGNIFDLDSGHILHQVNCMGVMGAGIAGRIAKKHPVVKENYLNMCDRFSKQERLGKLQLVQVAPKLSFFNSFSQFAFGRDENEKYTEEDLLIGNIERAASIARQNNQPLYVPFNIGCGLGGGDWDLIWDGIKDLDNVLVVHKPEK